MDDRPTMMQPADRSGPLAARPDARAAFEANAVALVDAFRGEPWAEVVEAPDLTLAITGIPIPAMNLVARSLLDPSTADARIGEVIHVFRRRAVPFSWWVFPTSEPEDLADRLIRSGLADSTPAPAMALDLGSWIAPRAADRLTVEPVAAGAVWHATAGVMAAGFDLPGSLTPILEERFGALLGRPDMRWFAARLDGAVVACALSVPKDGVVGIYNVATIPTARGHGAGSAVTAAAIADGQRDGCRLAVLESSPAGYGVYRRLGFEDVGVVRILAGR